MFLRIPIFVSSVNNLSDARYCAGMGVTWMGFSSLELDDLFTETELNGLIQWVEGVKTVFERRSNKSVSEEFIQQFDFQLFTEETKNKVITQEHFLEVRYEGNGFSDLESKDATEIIILVSDQKELSEKDKTFLVEFCKNNKVILGFGIELKNLDWIEKELKPVGILLKGGKEIRPGLKNFDEMAEILEYLEAEE